MKNLFYLLLLNCSFSLAQVGVGNTNPQAAVDITSTDSGMLIPRVELVDTTDINTVLNPDGSTLIQSTIVYNTITRNDVVPAFYYWNGVDKWLRLLVADDNEDIWKSNPVNGRVEIDKLSDGVTDRPNNNVYITDESQLIIDQVNTNNDNGGSRKIQVYNGDIANYSNIPSTGAFGFIGHKSRGDIETPTSVLAGDNVAGFYAEAHNGTEYKLSSYLMQGVDTSWDGIDPLVPGNFQFHTTSPGVFGEKMRLTYDGFLGINTTVPTEALEVHGNAGNGWDGDIDVYSQGTNITSFHIRSSGGTRMSPRRIGTKSNANIFNIEAQGYDGDQYITASAIKLGVTATSATADDVMPGRILFATRPYGVNSLRDRMIIDANGNVGIGRLTGLTEKLEINGTIKATDINFTGILEFADDAAAGTGGLVIGDVYRTGNILKIKIT